MCACVVFLFVFNTSKQTKKSFTSQRQTNKELLQSSNKKLAWCCSVNYYFHCKLSNKLNFKLESRWWWWWCDDGRWRKSRRPVWNKLSRNKEGRRVLHSLRVFSQVTKLFKVFLLSKDNQLSPEKVWFLLVSFSFFFLNNYFLT